MNYYAAYHNLAKKFYKTGAGVGLDEFIRATNSDGREELRWHGDSILSQADLTGKRVKRGKEPQLIESVFVSLAEMLLKDQTLKAIFISRVETKLSKHFNVTIARPYQQESRKIALAVVRKFECFDYMTTEQKSDFGFIFSHLIKMWKTGRRQRDLMRLNHSTAISAMALLWKGTSIDALEALFAELQKYNNTYKHISADEDGTLAQARNVWRYWGEPGDRVILDWIDRLIAEKKLMKTIDMYQEFISFCPNLIGNLFKRVRTEMIISQQARLKFLDIVKARNCAEHFREPTTFGETQGIPAHEKAPVLKTNALKAPNSRQRRRVVRKKKPNGEKGKEQSK